MNADDRLDALAARATANRSRLDVLREQTKKRIVQMKPGEEVRAVFDLLVYCDLNAVALEGKTEGMIWGFAQHDARFLRSLRDQAIGHGQQGKPLTRSQLNTVRVVMLREPYLTQVAILTDDQPDEKARQQEGTEG